MPSGLFYPSIWTKSLLIQVVSVLFFKFIRKHSDLNAKSVVRAKNPHDENTPILKISLPKAESFQIKILIFFILLLKTWIVGTR